MNNLIFLDEKGNKFSAELIFALTVPQLNKTFIALNNSDLVFNKESSYNNLDILELIREENNSFFVSDVLEEDWDLVKQTIIDELLSKIK